MTMNWDFIAIISHVFTINIGILGTHALLLYPENTLFQFTLGISVPVTASKRGSVAHTAAFQFNYKLPSDLEDLQPMVDEAKSMEPLKLQDIYTTIENSLLNRGWGDGRQCLLRIICEVAEIPFDRSQDDFFLEIIHLLLTPTEDIPEPNDIQHEVIDELYHEAEILGKSGGDCILAYPNCTESPLEAFTQIIFL